MSEPDTAGLRDKITKILSNNGMSDEATWHATPAVVELVEAELAQARIDELERIQRDSNSYGGDTSYSKHPFYVVEALDIDERLAELRTGDNKEAE